VRGEFARPPLAILGAILLFSWGWLFLDAHYHWSPNSYYNFAWAVPVLAGYLIYRRGQTCSFEPQRTGGQRLTVALAASLGISVILVAFFRLFSEANPFWRLPLWGHGFVLLSFSCLCLLFFFGRKGLCHFFFPTAFLLLALPWPWRIEQSLIQMMTGTITEMTTLSLNLMGYPAMAKGNVIQIGEIRLGVEEACSGIRSLQSLTMIALFLGEFFRFRTGRRAVLLLTVAGLVLVFNWGRALSLSLVTLGNRADQFTFWHDFLGNFNFIASCVILFVVGELLIRLAPISFSRPQLRCRFLQGAASLKWVGLIVVSFGLVEAGISAYYRTMEAHVTPLQPLTLNWDQATDLSFEILEVPESVASVLEFDFGERISLQWDDGMIAFATFYGYTGEDQMASVSSFGHSPEVCLTAVGGKPVRTKDPLQARIQGEDVVLENYEFAFSGDGHSQVIKVFWLVWEPRNMGVMAEDLQSLSWKNQWMLVKSGRRDFSRQVILIRFPGEFPDALIEKRLRRLLREVSK
jgi:exosortase